MRRAGIGTAVVVAVAAAAGASTAVAGVVGIAPFTCQFYEHLCTTEAEKDTWRRKREAEKRREEERARAVAEAEARRKAEVDRFADTYGGHRSAEAEKLRQMRLKAEAASGAKTPAPVQKCEPSYTESSGWGVGASEAEARAQAQAKFDNHSCRIRDQVINVQAMRCSSARYGFSQTLRWNCAIKFTCKMELKSCGKGASRQ